MCTLHIYFICNGPCRGWQWRHSWTAVNNKQLRMCMRYCYTLRLLSWALNDSKLIGRSQFILIEASNRSRSEQRPGGHRGRRQWRMNRNNKQIEMSSNKLNANKCRLWHSNNLFAFLSITFVTSHMVDCCSFLRCVFSPFLFVSHSSEGFIS